MIKTTPKAVELYKRHLDNLEALADSKTLGLVMPFNCVFCKATFHITGKDMDCKACPLDSSLNAGKLCNLDQRRDDLRTADGRRTHDYYEAEMGSILNRRDRIIGQIREFTDAKI